MEMELSSLIFQEVTFRLRKMKKQPALKKCLIFWEKELSSPKLKKLFTFFQEELTGTENQKFIILLFAQKTKRKMFLIFSL